MQGFMKKITEWMLDKEENLAKNCSLPMKEIEYQLQKVEQEKEKVQIKYDESMALLNEVSQRVEKMKNIEILRCQKE